MFATNKTEITVLWENTTDHMDCEYLDQTIAEQHGIKYARRREATLQEGLQVLWAFARHQGIPVSEYFDGNEFGPSADDLWIYEDENGKPLMYQHHVHGDCHPTYFVARK